MDSSGCGTEAGGERIGPGQFFVFDHLKVAAEIGIFLPFRRQHHGAEDAAGAQVDLTIYGAPRQVAEPWVEMFRLCPCLPDQFLRHIDDAFESEIKSGIGLISAVHDRCPFSEVDGEDADQTLLVQLNIQFTPNWSAKLPKYPPQNISCNGISTLPLAASALNRRSVSGRWSGSKLSVL